MTRPSRRVSGPRPLTLWIATVIAMAGATLAFAREVRSVGIALAILAGLASAGAVWQWIRSN